MSPNSPFARHPSFPFRKSCEKDATVYRPRIRGQHVPEMPLHDQRRQKRRAHLVVVSGDDAIPARRRVGVLRRRDIDHAEDDENHAHHQRRRIANSHGVTFRSE